MQMQFGALARLNVSHFVSEIARAHVAAKVNDERPGYHGEFHQIVPTHLTLSQKKYLAIENGEPNWKTASCIIFAD